MQPNNYPNVPDTPETNQNPEIEPTTLGMPSQTSQTSQTDFNNQPAPAESSAPTPPPTPKKSRKWLPAVVVAGVLAVLVGSTALGYTMWYQAPEKVVGDALAHAVSQKSIQTKTVITSDSELAPGTLLNLKLKKLTFDMAGDEKPTGDMAAEITLEVNGREYTFGGQARFVDSGEIYFKINDIKELTSKLITDFGMNEYFDESINQVYDEIQNKWVLVTKDDLGPEGADYWQCAVDATKKISQDEDATAQAQEIYRQNSFFEVGDQVGTEDGNLGYRVSIDEQKFKDYAKAYEDTEHYKELMACSGEETQAIDDDLETSLNEVNENVESTMTMWISRFTHQLQAIDYTVTVKSDTQNVPDTSFTGRTEFGFDADWTAEKPADAVPFTEWQSNIEDVVESIMPASQPSFDTVSDDEFILEQST